MLKCSHGLAYEMKCWDCVSEGLGRVTLDVETLALKKSVPVGVVGGLIDGVQVVVDQIQNKS